MASLVDRSSDARFDHADRITKLRGDFTLPEAKSLEDAVVIRDRAQAITWALSRARPGDCVLIAGKGDDNHQHIGMHCHWFDDRELACQWLYEEAQHGGFPFERRRAA